MKTMPWMVEAEKIAKIQGCRRRFVEHMKTVEYPEEIPPFDAEKAKLCSDGQIFPRNGRFNIAEAQEFLDVWASQERVGPRSVDHMYGKCDCKLGSAREELDVDTRHDYKGVSCTFMMNEWRAIWLLRDGHQHVWKEGSEGCTPYLRGPYKGGRTRLKFIKALGYKVPASYLKKK